MTLRDRNIETRQTDNFPPPRSQRSFLFRTLLVFASALVLASVRSAGAQAIRIVPIAADDLAFSALTGRLYTSVAATGSITEIDPATGTIGVSIPVGSPPGRVVISDTGEYLCVALDGLPGCAGAGRDPIGTPLLLGSTGPGARPPPGRRPVGDAATRTSWPSPFASPPRDADAGVAIHQTVSAAVVTPDGVGSTVIDFGGSAARLDGYDNETSESGFRRMEVDANGVTVLDNATGVLEGAGLDGEYQGRLRLLDRRPHPRSRTPHDRGDAARHQSGRQPGRGDARRELLPHRLVAVERRRAPLALEGLRSGERCADQRLGRSRRGRAPPACCTWAETLAFQRPPAGSC